ncbi:MAG: CHAT domain-containing protein [Pseudonocardiaceae bacterium]
MSDTTIEGLLPYSVVSSGFSEAPEQGDEKAAEPAAAPALKVTIIWGGLAHAEADIHLAGHYQGVMPSAAERSLDEAISPPGPCGIICEHTRRRWLVGALGEVTYFPGRVGAPNATSQVVRAAVVGMGRVGTFSQDNACRLYQSLLREVLALRHIRTVATVLIGSGAGNLSMHQVARSVVTGFSTALRGLPADRDLIVPEVCVVEQDRLRAELGHRALLRAAEAEPLIVVGPAIGRVPGGRVGADAAAVYGIRGLLKRLASASDPATPSDPALATILAAVPDELRDDVYTRLTEIASHPEDIVGVTMHAPRESRRHRADNGEGDQAPPTRVTALSGPTGFIWSALTARATVPEREMPLNESLVEDLVRRLTPPSGEDLAELSAFLTRFMVPHDLQRYLDGRAPLIIEVDLHTAVVPWELLTSTAQVSGPPEESEPLAIQQCLSRQMRSSYARTDPEESSVEGMRALVVGDPGDPSRGQSLPESRGEAAAVAGVLRDHKIEVDLFIGSPGSIPTPGAQFATRLDVLAKMLSRNYHIIHYAGHGVFDPERPELSGWLFADGLLAARELTQLSQAPRLVVADACWSAARPEARADEKPPPGRRGALAPVLADEFLRVGTGHFIGASWSVPDEAARKFATSFYKALLGSGGKARLPVGQAIRRSRRILWDDANQAESLSPERRFAWAAYQHYGDPGDHLLPEIAARRRE